MGELRPDASLAELWDHVRLHERQLEAVLHVTHALQERVVELDSLLEQALVTAMEVVEADAGSIILHDPARRKLMFRHAEGPTKDKVIGLEIDDTQGIAGDVFHSGVGRISQNVMAERTHIRDIEEKTNYATQTMITVPLSACTGETIGVVQVLNKRSGTFDASDMDVLQVICTQIAVAIINAQLFEKAQAAAIVDLLGQISHDIKNLLTPVGMAAETLRMMLADFYALLARRVRQEEACSLALADEVDAMVAQVSADAGEILDILDESTQIAQQRAKEIADSVKGMTSAAAFEPTDLNEVLRSVERVLRVVAGEAGVALVEEAGDVPTDALLDGKRMYNVCYNLIHNAIGATPRGGSVTVRTAARVEGTFPDGCFLQFQVQDTGCGMPSEAAAKLFSGNMKSSKAGGTGLGTRVVKNVIAAHGGVLMVDSTPGAGTTITARVPLRREKGDQGPHGAR